MGRVADEGQEQLPLGDDTYTVEATLMDSRGLRWAFRYNIKDQALPPIEVLEDAKESPTKKRTAGPKTRKGIVRKKAPVGNNRGPSRRKK